MKINLPVNYRTLNQAQRKRVREQYIELQKSICTYCQSSLNEQPPKEILEKKLNRTLFPPNFLKFPIHLHHDHQTGMTEGAVHAYCNGVMWQYENR